MCSAEVMKNVRTVQYEELSDDQIKAARMRRSRDRYPQPCSTVLTICQSSWRAAGAQMLVTCLTPWHSQGQAAGAQKFLQTWSHVGVQGLHKGGSREGGTAIKSPLRHEEAGAFRPCSLAGPPVVSPCLPSFLAVMMSQLLLLSLCPASFTR